VREVTESLGLIVANPAGEDETLAIHDLSHHGTIETIAESEHLCSPYLEN